MTKKMSFERQYPRHAIQLTATQKLHKQYEEQQMKEQEVIEYNNQVKHDVLTMLWVTPVALVTLYMLFVVIWTMTPQHWW